ncbi:Patatin-like phospholipase domain-containing protein 2 [Takifugu flavidus]|uniref:Patatin-like phospholipase domain-containing protein 2 n=1 Tax=Takifugu flavidus TaxID=433684 RepID=A0A5C6P9Q2_9TELE|nr:Patatin-like phospholipase domain-containing protein 2 [Takifugu flavidus]
MPPGRLPGEVFRACPSGRRPPGRPRTRWRDYVSRLVWERLGIPPDELEEVAGEREVWASLLRLLPPATRPRISGGEWMDMDGWLCVIVDLFSGSQGSTGSELAVQRRWRQLQAGTTTTMEDSGRLQLCNSRNREPVSPLLDLPKTQFCSRGSSGQSEWSSDPGMMFNWSEEWNLSFAGCGFRSVYYLGALSCFLDRVPQLVHGATRICGVWARNPRAHTPVSGLV